MSDIKCTWHYFIGWNISATTIYFDESREISSDSIEINNLFLTEPTRDDVATLSRCSNQLKIISH